MPQPKSPPLLDWYLGNIILWRAWFYLMVQVSHMILWRAWFYLMLQGSHLNRKISLLKFVAPTMFVKFILRTICQIKYAIWVLNWAPIMFSLFSFLFSTLIVEHMNIKGIFCVNNIVHILEYGNVMMQYTWLAIIILSHFIAVVTTWTLMSFLCLQPLLYGVRFMMIVSTIMPKNAC